VEILVDRLPTRADPVQRKGTGIEKARIDVDESRSVTGQIERAEFACRRAGLNVVTDR